MKEKDLKQSLLDRKIKAPNFFVRWCFNLWCKINCNRNNVVFDYKFAKKSIKKQQILLLSTHSSRNEFFYSLYGMRRKNMNIVCGFQHFFKNKTNYHALNMMGVIPKMLFQPDLSSARKMLGVMKKGHSLALFPEGIQSMSGSAHPINPATAKFVKRAGVTVVLSKSQGAYLTTNRYSPDVKKGKVIISYEILFTADELKTLTEEQVYKRMLERFVYDDFSANKVNRIKYVGKLPNVHGLDNILYLCPQCKKHHSMVVDGDQYVCANCGHAVTLNEYYDLITTNGQTFFDDIDKWFKWQRRTMQQDAKAEDFQLKGVGRLVVLRTDKWRKPPQNRKVVFGGEVTLTHKGLTIDNGKEQMFFDIDNLYSLTLVVGKHLEFYYKDDYFQLELDCPKTHLVGWMLASEELHNLHDARWYSVSNDVYGYDQKENM